MRRVTRSVVCVCLVPGVLALTACAGNSAKPATAAKSSATPTAAAPASNAGLTGNQFETALDNAITASSIKSLHVTGAIWNSGVPAKVDLQFTQTTVTGSVALGTLATFPVLGTADGSTYAQATPSLLAFLNQGVASGLPKVSAPVNSWISNDGTVSRELGTFFGGFFTLSSFTTGMQAASLTYTADGTSTINGQQVADYKETATNTSSAGNVTWNAVLSVPLTGPALPIQEVVTSSYDGAPAGTTTYAWNQPTTPVTAPPASEIYSGS